VSECDREVSIIRGPWPSSGFGAISKEMSLVKQLHAAESF